MTDEQLIKAIAKIWVENGGDADGIEWCKEKIKEEVKKLKQNEM